MDPKKKEKKVGFFKRLKLAIFNMEEYGMFLTERFWKAFGYFAILMLLISISLTFAYHYRVSNKLLSYIKNEMPEVSFNDGVLKSEQNVEAYDSTFNFRVFINTDDAVSEETLKGYDEKIGNTELALMFFKDKATIASYMVDPSITDLTQEIKEEDIILYKQDLDYKVIMEGYPEFKFAGNEAFETMLREDIIPVVMANTFLPVTALVFIGEFIQMFGDVCVVAIIGYIAAVFLGVRFKLSPILSLAIYSLSLSFVLKGAYETANVVTGLYIEYFDVVYLVIGYIYIIAAIFMIKYDLIKQREELQKILQVQEEVKKELEEKEKKEVIAENTAEEKSEENKEDEEISDTEQNKEEQEEKEPDGSEI